MIIYFVDRNLDILGHASTSLHAGYHLFGDHTVEELETGVNSFECTIVGERELESIVTVGKYILKQSGESTDYDSLYQITETEYDAKSQELRIYCEDAGLDLLNKVCPAVSLNGSLSYMLNYFKPSGWTVNPIGTPTTTKSYKWDGESTATERLMSVVGLWNCELYYSFDIDGTKITARNINVIPKRGLTHPEAQLKLNYDIDNIITTKSIANLVTAVQVTGGTPQGSDTPINLVNYTYNYTDPATGDVYTVHKATGQMRNTTAMQRWASALDTDGLLLGTFQFDTSDKATLAGQARAYLQRQCQIEVNYDVDFARLPEDTQLGDRVMIIDDAGELYLDARILRIETSVSDGTRRATIGEYLLRSDGIASQVYAMSQTLQAQIASDQANREAITILTETVDAMSTLEVESNIFMNTATLKAHLYKGETDIRTDYDPSWFKWILRNDSGERLLARGYELTVSMDVIGYASTILCKFVQPQLYDLTDSSNNVITDHNENPIQVSYAGVYTPPTRARLLRAVNTQGIPIKSREVNLYEEGYMRQYTQHFWTEETGENAGVHITEIEKDDFLSDPQNGGGNLLARSNGISVRDGTEELAVFGGDGMRIGKNNEKHISVTNESFSVYDEDGSVPFSVDTSGSLRTQDVTRVGTVSGADDDYPTFTSQIYLRGNLVDNKIYFGTSTTGAPTSYTASVTVGGNVVVDGVRCFATKTAGSIIRVSFSNTNSTARFVGCQYSESYYETSVKVNDALLDSGYNRLAVADTTGHTIPNYCYVTTYGKLAMLSLCIYNTSSIVVGDVIYAGSLLNFIPDNATQIVGQHGASDVIIGVIQSDGSIHINNTASSAFSTSATNYISLHATYIFK